MQDRLHHQLNIENLKFIEEVDSEIADRELVDFEGCQILLKIDELIYQNKNNPKTADFSKYLERLTKHFLLEEAVKDNQEYLNLVYEFSKTCFDPLCSIQQKMNVTLLVIKESFKLTSNEHFNRIDLENFIFAGATYHSENDWFVSVKALYELHSLIYKLEPENNATPDEIKKLKKFKSELENLYKTLKNNLTHPPTDEEKISLSTNLKIIKATATLVTGFQSANQVKAIENYSKTCEHVVIPNSLKRKICTLLAAALGCIIGAGVCVATGFIAAPIVGLVAGGLAGYFGGLKFFHDSRSLLPPKLNKQTEDVMEAAYKARKL